tara:strand:+ start:667 stop:1296 length:630 start_codon:yes stop_codon:yes gene_type:complete
VSLIDLLQLNRKSKKLTLMNLVEMTGLSYGKVYRIFNGGIDKPTPDSLKLLAKALQLDYSYLFHKAGYLSSLSKKTMLNNYALPILSWDFCYLAFPFQEPLSAGLSDEHYYYHRKLDNGFVLTVNKTHALFPFFNKGDKLICDPIQPPQHNDTVIYIDTAIKQFKFGIYKCNDQKPYITSLHQSNYKNILIDDSIQSLIVGNIILHEKS